MFGDDIFPFIATICYLNLPHYNFFFWIIRIFEIPTIHQRIAQPFEKRLISAMDVLPFE
jgi:hypothetical protein